MAVNLGRRHSPPHSTRHIFAPSTCSPTTAKLAPAVRDLYPGALEAFRDSYLVEFLQLADHSEADPHAGLVEQLKRFLIELGRDSASSAPVSAPGGWPQLCPGGGQDPGHSAVSLQQ
jgi:hypothetical protein